MISVKTEKKTVQFSEDIQVETIEPEPEPVYIDEVRRGSAAWLWVFKTTQQQKFKTTVSIPSINIAPAAI